MASRSGWDVRRWVAMTAVLVTLLALMGWWSALHRSGDVGLQRFVESPMDGQPIVLTLGTVQQVMEHDRFELRRGTLTFVVVGPTADLTVGEEVSVGGVMKGTAVVQQWRATAPLRRAKKGLGLLAIAAVLWGSKRTVRWCKTGWGLRG